MEDVIDFSAIPEEERLAYYGLLFSLAAADGSFCPDELLIIHSLLELSGMSIAARDQLKTYQVSPPDIGGCLDVLSSSRNELRFGTMMSLIDIALADGVTTEREEDALEIASFY